MNKRVVQSFQFGAILTLVLLITFGCGSKIGPQDLVISNVQLVLADESLDRGPVTIVIYDGVIADIGPADSVKISKTARVIDGKGRFAMPGLADMHFHVSIRDPKAENPLAPLKEALHWGVTTIFDPGIDDQSDEIMKKTLETGVHDYPNVVKAIGIFTAKDGYGYGWVKPFFVPQTAEEARQNVRDLKEMGAVAVKLTYEDMRWLATKLMPLPDPEIMRVIIDEAEKQNMVSFVHAPTLDLAKETLRAGVDVLAHGIIDKAVDEEFLSLMKGSGATYMSTSTVYQSFAGLQKWLDRLEEYDISGWMDPEQIAFWRDKGEVAIMPMFDKAPIAQERLVTLRENLAAVVREGIPIVLGTDTALPGVFPGISLHVELELHAEAGLSPEQILKAATIDSAKLLGRDSETGSLEVGKVADILILNADPLEDISNTKHIYKVIRAGETVELPSTVEK